MKIEKAGKRNKFVLTKRFEVWAEIEVYADNIEDALAKAKKMSFWDFFSPGPATEIIDATTLDGLGVREVW